MSVGKYASSIELLYSDHHRWLFGWFRRKLGCVQQADDLAHDTFLRLIDRQVPLVLHEPRAFLTTVAKGLLINHWRRLDIERAYLRALAERPPAVGPSPEERALVVEALVAVDAMLVTLPEKPRRAFLMAQLDGLTYREIAAELGVSERMIKKYMARAMRHCLETL